MIKFNIGEINLSTRCEGPYNRLAIWFQGCTLNCKGCCNPHLQKLEIKNIISLEDLINVIKKAKDDFNIEGVTYLGGEPTLQKDLAFLSKEIHNLGLGIICFTGMLFEDVKERLLFCDLVIDGKFDQSKLDDKRKLIGSTNQRLIHQTNRYKKDESWFYDNTSKSVEISINDTITINGEVV